jgi:hypothetical protein
MNTSAGVFEIAGATNRRSSGSMAKNVCRERVFTPWT